MVYKLYFPEYFIISYKLYYREISRPWYRINYIVSRIILLFYIVKYFVSGIIWIIFQNISSVTSYELYCVEYIVSGHKLYEHYCIVNISSIVLYNLYCIHDRKSWKFSSLTIICFTINFFIFEIRALIWQPYSQNPLGFFLEYFIINEY